MYITDISKHCLKVDFEIIPENYYVSVVPYNDKEKKITSEVINKLLKKGVLIKCNTEKSNFISSVCTRKKKDDAHHLEFKVV